LSFLFLIIIFQKEPALDFGGVYKAKVIEIAAGGLMVNILVGIVF
jgi:hypothetical protein